MTDTQHRLVLAANELSDDDLFHLTRLLLRLWWERTRKQPLP